MAEMTKHRFDLSMIPAIRRLVVRKRVQVSSLWLMFWGLINLYTWAMMNWGPEQMYNDGLLGKWWESNLPLFLGVLMLGVGVYTFLRRPQGGVRIEGYMLLGLAAINTVYLGVGLLTMERSGPVMDIFSGLATAIVIQAVLGFHALSRAKLLAGWSQESSEVTPQMVDATRDAMKAFVAKPKGPIDGDSRLRASVRPASFFYNGALRTHMYVGECFSEEAYFITKGFNEFHTLSRALASVVKYRSSKNRVVVSWKTKFGRRRYEMGIFDAIQLKEWAGVPLKSKDVQTVCRCVKSITATRLAGILEYCDDAKLRVKLLSAVGKVIPSDDVATVLHRWARCDQPEVQLMAAEKMAVLRIGGLEPSLSGWLVSESAYLRRAAAIYLSAHPDTAYLERLDERMRIEDDRTTRGALKKAIKACTKATFGTQDEFPSMRA